MRWGIIFVLWACLPLLAETPDEFYEQQIKRLSSTDPKEIGDAMDRLTFVRGNRGIRSILEALVGNPNFPSAPINHPAVKFYATKALARKKEPIAIPTLLKTFSKESAKISEETSKKRTLKDGVKDSAHLSSPEFYEDGEHTTVLVCGEILRALAEFPLTTESEDLLKKSLTFPNYYIRASAADALYSVGKKEYIPILRTAYDKEENPYTKISLASALVAIERMPNELYRFTLEQLMHEDPRVRRKASEALVRSDFHVSAPYLEKAIELENNSRVLLQMKADYAKITAFPVP